MSLVNGLAARSTGRGRLHSSYRGVWEEGCPELFRNEIGASISSKVLPLLRSPHRCPSAKSERELHRWRDGLPKYSRTLQGRRNCPPMRHGRVSPLTRLSGLVRGPPGYRNRHLSHSPTS